MHIRARVVRGRLIVDEATDLPEGTVLDLVVDDEADDLSDEERQIRNAAIIASFRGATAGTMRDAKQTIAALRRLGTPPSSTQ